MSRRRVGDTNPRGQLERNLGLFRLRDGLTAPGDIPMTAALDLVFADWDRQQQEGRVGAPILDRYKLYVEGMARFVATRGFTAVKDLTVNVLKVWVRLPNANTRQPVTRGTMVVRRAAVRAFFETANCLGITDANPAKLIELPGDASRYVKALTDDQIHHLQRLARNTLSDLRTPAAFAVVMSGATCRELAFITVDDVDLPNRRVWVHDGGYRQRDRWVPLFDDWCVRAVSARVNALRTTHGDAAGGTWLVYQPHPTSPNPERQHSALNVLITRLMKTARVHRPGLTRAESIREWLALQVYVETGSVEAVALRLGMSSLDAAAHLVGHDWVAEADTLHEPPAHRQGGRTLATDDNEGES